MRASEVSRVFNSSRAWGVAPVSIEARKEEAGRLYNVGEFAAEVALAAVEPIPTDNTRYVGDVSDFVEAS